MNNKLILSVLAFSLILVMSSFALAADPQVIFNSPIEGHEYQEEVNYDVYVDFPSENITAYEVDLFTENDEFLSGDSGSYQNNAQGNFILESDGNYYLYALFALDDGTVIGKKVYFTVNFSINNPLRILGYSNPTPLNGAIINSNNIATSKIVAVSNKDTTAFTVYLQNESDSWLYEYSPSRKTDFNFIDRWNVDFYDGAYSFYTEAAAGLDTKASAVRNVTIKATVPTATDINVSGIPTSINEDVSFSFIATMNVSEQPVKVRFTATSSAGFKTFGSHSLTNYSGENLTFSGAIANPGVYDIKLVVSDDYGNSESYYITNITVNDVIEPTVTERRRHHGSSSNEVNTSNQTGSKSNLTLVEFNPETQQEEIPEESKPESDGFFSFITGAVTGAFSTPPRAILTFIIIIVIIYAIVKIRGYIVADKDEGKSKKGNKKSKKEENDEETQEE